MRWPRIIFLLLVATVLGAFFHYTLPQRSIVRIVDTEALMTEIDGWNRRFFASPDAGASGNTAMREVRFINTVQANGRPLVFRNEDTGVLWPPYFKFDSQDLQTEAGDLRSTSAEPQWVAVTHYGWRVNFFSIYPNALSIESVAGPDVRLFPWMPLAVLAVLALFVFMAWRIWERFEDRVITPIVDGATVRWAKFKDRLGGRG